MNLVLLLLVVALSSTAAAQPQSAVVIVPVADVWSRPLAPDEKSLDDLRETQVLFGEKVLIHESSGAWTRIEALEQPEFTHNNRWEGYPGWVLAETLNTDQRKPGMKPRDIHHTRHFPTKNAMAYLSVPYMWGGLSEKGLDCSGLTHLSFRLFGIQIPRDSHEQWMKAKPIKRVELKPGDLIFSAKAENPKKITHVTLYAGKMAVDGWLIEAPQTGMVVRKISFNEKYGKPLKDVESGDKVGERVMYFGSFVP